MRLGICAILLLASFGAAVAVSEQDKADCLRGGSAARIKGCTEILLDPGLTREGRILALGNRGDAYADSRDFQRAIDDLTEVLRLDERHVPAYVRRGAVYVDTGEIDKAFADLEEAARLGAASASFFVARASVFYHKRDVDQALAELDEAIKLHPDVAFLFAKRG